MWKISLVFWAMRWQDYLVLKFTDLYQATANSERWHYFDANTPPGKGAFLAYRIISFQSHNAPHIDLNFVYCSEKVLHWEMPICKDS